MSHVNRFTRTESESNYIESGYDGKEFVSVSRMSKRIETRKWLDHLDSNLMTVTTDHYEREASSAGKDKFNTSREETLLYKTKVGGRDSMQSAYLLSPEALQQYQIEAEDDMNWTDASHEYPGEALECGIPEGHVIVRDDCLGLDGKVVPFYVTENIAVEDPQKALETLEGLPNVIGMYIVEGGVQFRWLPTVEDFEANNSKLPSFKSEVL